VDDNCSLVGIVDVMQDVAETDQGTVFLLSVTDTLHFNSHFPGEPGLAGCPLNSPSPFIPGLCILLGQA